MQRAARAWETANVTRAVELLDAHRPGPTRPDLRGWEWHYLWGLCHRSLATYRAAGPLSLSPDGRLLATAGDNPSTIAVREAVTGEKRYTLSAPGPLGGLPAGLGWSPDGRSLASGERGLVHIWDLSTRQIRQTLRHTDRDGCAVQAVAWSPDGRFLASAANADVVKVWKLATGKESLTLANQSPDEWGPGFSLAFSPDGTWLAVASSRGSTGAGFPVKVWATTDGHEVVTLPGHPTAPARVAFSPDGRYLAVAGTESAGAPAPPAENVKV
jgi:WD40 repeat protein